MIRSAAGLIVLVSSLGLAAQNSNGTGANSSGSSEPELLISQASNGERTSACPIGMYASQSLWNHNIAVQKGIGNEKFGQRISLSLRDSHPARIVAATVRVHGLNGKNRMLLTPTDSNQKWSAVKTLRVKFLRESDGSVSGDLWIGGFTSVGLIELIDVSYADGSMWRQAGLNLCRVQPDPMMLISNK